MQTNDAEIDKKVTDSNFEIINDSITNRWINIPGTLNAPFPTFSSPWLNLYSINDDQGGRKTSQFTAMVLTTSRWQPKRQTYSILVLHSYLWLIFLFFWWT